MWLARRTLCIMHVCALTIKTKKARCVMKLNFDLEFDENKPTGKSSGGNPKWVAQTDIDVDGKKFSVYIDVYLKQSKPEPKAAKPAVKIKAS